MKFLFVFLVTVIIERQACAQTVNNNIGISAPFYIPSEKKIAYKIGETIVTVKIFQYGKSNNIVYINLHANEATAVEATRAILEKEGGTLIKIENRNQRVIRFLLNGSRYGFDPNRIFSMTGIIQTLKENKRYSKPAAEAVHQFATALLELIPDSISAVIALHNNFNGAYSIRSYLLTGERQRDAKAVYQQTDQDEDDIVLTTDSLLYQKMADAGFNSIWQDNINAKKDGSLSVYYGEKKTCYINIETEHGKTAQYKLMLEAVLLALNKDKNIEEQTSEINKLSEK